MCFDILSHDYNTIVTTMSQIKPMNKKIGSKKSVWDDCQKLSSKLITTRYTNEVFDMRVNNTKLKLDSMNEILSTLNQFRMNIKSLKLKSMI